MFVESASEFFIEELVSIFLKSRVNERQINQQAGSKGIILILFRFDSAGIFKTFPVFSRKNACNGRCI